MTVNLSQLRAFLAVVDAGGFSAAAAELGLSQSAVSHAVASLERELTAPLLVRASPVRTTALGERVVPHARTAVAAARSVEQLAADAATMTGTVRLAATPTVCQGLVPGLLRHWGEDQPRVTVRVFEGDSAEIAAWLENETADAAIP
ncbi:LysR family transcriptional regulator [Streptomyces sp. NPDC127172]|uniref:LysR family transcriptional regulator n=1 Tax=Streptomyces sp. NPDC127172 TaxID=3345382 RepID=UPI00362D796D